MRVVRVRYRNTIFYGTIDGQTVRPLSKDTPVEGPVPIDQALVLAPVTPTKIICLGFNYAEHAEEFAHDLPDEPVLFLKPPSAVVGPGQPIVLPPQSTHVAHEGELAVVMGRACRNVSAAEAAPYVFGYCCGNDVTARDLQKKDGQYGRAKGFDTFCPIGPWIETEVDDPGNLVLRTLVNGEVAQQSTTANMLFKPLDIVSYVSGIMTLMPGDVILTGTPSGSTAIKAGDEVRVEIERVGVLVNPVAEAEQAERAEGDEGDEESEPPLQ
ncbi:MAG: fumarylacetoacetate hydrolase family protein [Desulfovibrionaceae bacterium]|jgi:2-keto-4-pentenoate hydratase/2-oxohepta-3-ene-1,7-dioic acid hydratase in catechol pathway|nr:fumarylacetoacetate hydrolase family protein [Desulfovibrionaceae bacterium]